MGRAKDDARISYTTLTQYRSALLFWGGRAYDQRGYGQFNTRRLYNRLTEIIRFVAARYDLVVGPARNSTEIGVDELRIHHLAWCLGRICAVRPGSIARSETTKDSDGKNVISPTHPHNLMFSVPRRLLTIAIRRGILIGVDTLDE